MSNLIRRLEERAVATEITLMRWCDRMDLLALANARGEVSLHRLTWQRVWCLVPEKEDNVVDMTWRADGKVIAVAYRSGKIVLVEVENKNILHTIFIEDNITCISWQHDKSNTIAFHNSDEGDQETRITDESLKFLPDLPSTCTKFSSASKNPVENMFDLNFVKNQNDLNILIIGTESGVIHISIFGLLLCAVFNISSYLNKPCYVLNVHLSENLSSLYVMICDNSNNLQLVSMDTSILSSQTKELFAIALKHGHLVNLLSYLDSTMSSITQAWESILLEMDGKLSKYASKVPEGTVSADFLDLLMFGIPSDEMEEFLMQELTDKGLKKLGHSIELSYSNIQKLLLKHLTKVGQNITYHLAELKGMSRVTHRFKNLGLNEKTINSAIAANGAFLVKGVEVQQVINHSIANYKAFFRWLYVIILRLMDEQIPSEIPNMTQQDLAYITGFLQNFDNIGRNSSGQKKRFNLERLGQYLLDAPLTILPKNDSNIWTNFLEENSCVADHESIIKHYESMSLVQQHKRLIRTVEEIFIEPNELISTNIKYESHFICANISSVKNLRLSQLNYNDAVTMVAFYEKDSCFDGIIFVEINKTTPSILKCAHLHSSHIPEIENNNPCKILDFKFYSTLYLTILLEEMSEPKISYLCQVPISFIRANLVDKVLAQDSLLEQSDITRIDICDIPGNVILQIEGLNASKLDVSSSRHVCVVLSDNERKVQLFEMEADEDDDELEDTYMTANTSRDNSLVQESIVTE